VPEWGGSGIRFVEGLVGGVFHGNGFRAHFHKQILQLIGIIRISRDLKLYPGHA
jgi:hypothetical protein